MVQGKKLESSQHGHLHPGLQAVNYESQQIDRLVQLRVKAKGERDERQKEKAILPPGRVSDVSSA